MMKRDMFKPYGTNTGRLNTPSTKSILTVVTTLAEFKEGFNFLLADRSYCEWPADPGMFVLSIQEHSPGATLDEYKLIEMGIPFSIVTKDTNPILSRNQRTFSHVRFTEEGGIIHTGYKESDVKLDLQVMLYLDETELLAYMKEKLEEYKPLPWTNQLTNSRRYRARILLGI